MCCQFPQFFKQKLRPNWQPPSPVQPPLPSRPPLLAWTSSQPLPLPLQPLTLLLWSWPSDHLRFPATAGLEEFMSSWNGTIEELFSWWRGFNMSDKGPAKGPNDRLSGWWGHFQGRYFCILKRSCCSPMKKWILGLLRLHFWLWCYMSAAKEPNEWLSGLWGHFQGQSLWILKRSHHNVNRRRSPMTKLIFGLLRYIFDFDVEHVC